MVAVVLRVILVMPRGWFTTDRPPQRARRGHRATERGPYLPVQSLRLFVEASAARLPRLSRLRRQRLRSHRPLHSAHTPVTPLLCRRSAFNPRSAALTSRLSTPFLTTSPMTTS